MSAYCTIYIILLGTECMGHFWIEIKLQTINFQVYLLSMCHAHLLLHGTVCNYYGIIKHFPPFSQKTCRNYNLIYIIFIYILYRSSGYAIAECIII